MRQRPSILYAIWVCGWKWWDTMRGKYADDDDPKNDDKMTMLDHGWGFRDPDLVWDTAGSARHIATDYLVEWARLRPQRAAKLGSFVVLVLAGVIAILLLAIAGLAALALL